MQKWQCPSCGYNRMPLDEHDKQVRCVCGHVDTHPHRHKDLPGIIERGRNYAAAVKQWKQAGSPVRTDEQVESLLAICGECEHFSGKGCKLCGCKISRSKSAMLNKARMATESCPIDKWHAEPSSIITVRNLICHIAPVASNDTWLRNVRQLQKRWGLFNGKRIIAVSTGPQMLPPSVVAKALPDAEIIPVPNHIVLRESASFPMLLERVYSSDPAEATFYCHAKGVFTSGSVQGVMYWRNAMYHELLDRWPDVSRLLERFHFVGTHRRMHYGRHAYCFPDGITFSNWHFSGAFWWFRNAEIFSRDPLAKMQHTGYGVEAFPATICRQEETACIAFESMSNPYDPAAYPSPISDEGFPDPTASAAVLIELGGGDKPRGEGFVNVDRCESADVQLDLDDPNLHLPFESDSVSKVYSSHCFEHLSDPRPVLREVARVCTVGAHVEIVVPHWNSQMAMCHGHRCTISDIQVRHWTDDAVDYWFGGSAKILRLWNVERIPSEDIDNARLAFPQLTDDQLIKFVPDTCHEVRYHFHVVQR